MICKIAMEDPRRDILASDEILPSFCGFRSSFCRIHPMNFWRAHRRHVLALFLLLIIFILLVGPMRTRVYDQTYEGSSFIAGFEGKQRKSQGQEWVDVNIRPGLDIDDGLELQVDDRLETSRKKPEKMTSKVKMEEPESKKEDSVETPPQRSEPIVKIKNPNSWQRHLKKECERFHMYDPLSEENFNKDLFKHILVDDKHKVIYCQIPKVATITWRRIFIVSTGLANTTDPKAIKPSDIYGKYDDVLQYLGDLSADDIKYKLRHYFKFMFVREPMERLLSAYRNKLLYNQSTSDYFKRVLGGKIARDYRIFPASVNIDPQKPNVLFTEFVQYLTDPYHKKPLNEHWDKYHRLCYPCIIPYDFVGKLENAQTDANYVLRKTGMDEIALFPNRSEAHYRLIETKAILSRYYPSLSRSDIRNLVKEYEVDRYLFKYQLPEVIDNILHSS